jgi:cold shock CspA family protein
MQVYERKYRDARERLSTIDLNSLPEKRKRILVDLKLQSFSREFEWLLSQEEYGKALVALEQLRQQYEAVPRRLIDRRTRNHLQKMEYSLKKFVRYSEGTVLLDKVEEMWRWFVNAGCGSRDVIDCADQRNEVCEEDMDPFSRDIEDSGLKQGMVTSIGESSGIIESEGRRFSFQSTAWMGLRRFSDVDVGHVVLFRVDTNEGGGSAVTVFELMAEHDLRMLRFGKIVNLQSTFGFIEEEQFGNRLFFHRSFVKSGSGMVGLKLGGDVKFVLGRNERGICAKCMVITYVGIVFWKCWV